MGLQTSYKKQCYIGVVTVSANEWQARPHSSHEGYSAYYFLEGSSLHYPKRFQVNTEDQETGLSNQVTFLIVQGYSQMLGGVLRSWRSTLPVISPKL